MNVTTYGKASEFLLAAQAYLEEREVANGLMLGLCHRLIQFPERIETDPYFATAAHGGDIVFAAIMTPPHNLVISCARDDVGEAMELVALNLLESGWSFPGVLGPAQAAEEFAETWAEITGQDRREGMRQRVYELRRVIPPEFGQGRLRVATQDDMELIARWMTGFHRSVFRAGRPAADARELAESAIGDREVYLWEESGLPVSVAAKRRPMPRGITISYVYTPPEHRNRGYATACVAALSQLLLDSGYEFCTLFTDLANPTSNSIYQKIGYVPVCDFTEYVFGR